MTDNGTQFASTSVVGFCTQLGIQTKFVSVIHPQANGQAEAANKVILNGIKKKLEAAKGLWAEQLYEVSVVIHYLNVHSEFAFIKILSTTAFSFWIKISLLRNRYSGLTIPLHTQLPKRPRSLWYTAQTPCFPSKSTPQPGDVTILWRRVSSTSKLKLTAIYMQCYRDFWVSSH